MNYNVRFHGGPLAGKLRAYPDDPGRRLDFPASNGLGLIYERDFSDAATDHLAETGEHVYECVFNGLAGTSASLIV